MGRVNADWHRAHKMPRRATAEQRIAWHLAHAAACGCAPIPASVRAEMDRRGIAVPPAPASEKRPPD